MKTRLVMGTLLLLAGSRVQAGGSGIPKREDMPKYLKMLKTSVSAKDRALAAEMLGKRGQVVAADSRMPSSPC